MVLFLIYTRQVILTFASVDEISVYESSNDTYGAMLYLLLFRMYATLSCGTVYYAVQGGSNF